MAGAGAGDAVGAGVGGGVAPAFTKAASTTAIKVCANIIKTGVCYHATRVLPAIWARNL